MTADSRFEDVFRELLDAPDLELTDETRFTELPGWDSLVHVNTMFSLEETFGITFSGDEFSRLHTVGLLKHSLRAKGALG